MRPIDRVTAALDEHGCTWKEEPSGIRAQCPAHDDRNPSLSISESDDGRVLLCCHAGCETSAVLDALGLSYGDLFDDGESSAQARREAPPAGNAVYEYRAVDGTLIGAVKRYRRNGEKKFVQLTRVGEHWEACTPAPSGLKITPYNLPEVLRAVSEGREVLCVEGERDVETARSLGLVATCNAGGAGKWKREHAEYLHGARVLIVRDSDDPGRRHAAEVARSLQDIASSVRVADIAAGKDLTDHVFNGYGLEDLREVDNADDGPATGRRARITWASEIEPEPVVWAWEDAFEGRIAAGSLCLAAGREGTGKSTFGAWMTARITRGDLPGSFYGTPRRVLYVAVEDSWTRTIVPRLIAAGADRSKVGRFDVINDVGAEDVLSLPYDNALLETEILRNRIALVVIDPLMSAIGAKIDTHRERDVRTALDPLSKLADRTGAVLLGIAHFNKSGGTDAANLITGSGAFKNVARAVLGFAGDADGRVMTQVKNSLGRDDLPSLGYTIEEVKLSTKKGIARTSKLTFTGPSDRSVRDVLRDANGRGDADDDGEQSEQDYTVKWLRNYLVAAGGSAPFRDVLKAARAVDISERTLKRARTRAGVESERKGFQQGAVWRIDDQPGHREPDAASVGPNGLNGPNDATAAGIRAGHAHSGHSGQPVGVRDPQRPGGPVGVTSGGCDVCEAEPAVWFAPWNARRCATHNPMTYTEETPA